MGFIIMAKKASKKTSKKSARKETTQEIENEKICTILMYIFPIGQIWYLADESMKKSMLAKFHLKQSLVLIIAYVALHIIFAIIPFLWLIGWILILALFVLWIFGLIFAIQGEKKDIPVIGKFANKFTF